MKRYNPETGELRKKKSIIRKSPSKSSSYFMKRYNPETGELRKKYKTKW